MSAHATIPTGDHPAHSSPISNHIDKWSIGEELPSGDQRGQALNVQFNGRRGSFLFWLTECHFSVTGGPDEGVAGIEPIGGWVALVTGGRRLILGELASCCSVVWAFLVRESFSLDPSGLAMAFSSGELAGEDGGERRQTSGPGRRDVELNIN